MKKRTAVAIVCHGEKLLFFQRDNLPTIAEPNKWQFPGGHIEKGELPEKAIKRELKEEVSHVPSKLVFVGSVNLVYREVNVFWAYVSDEEVKRFKLGEEGQQIRFMTISEALRQDLTKGVKFYLSNFEELIKKHFRNDTVPSAKEISKVNWLKILFFDLVAF